MIGGIGSSTSSPIGTRAGGDTQRVDAANPRAANANGQPVATTMARIAAEGPPVETDRVAALRAAIRGGTYKADPDAIAARMIAADLA